MARSRRATAGAASLVLLTWAALARAAVPESSGEPALLASLRAALESGDLPEAVRAGEKAVAADPTSSEARDLLGRAYGLTAQDSPLLEQVRLAKKARECFARAVELDGTNVAALSDLARYDMRAPALLGGGRKKAKITAERVLALDPARGHVLLGELAEREKDPAAAEAQYRQAMAAAADSRGRRALSTFLVSRSRYADARALWVEPRAENALAAYELAGIALASGQGLPGAVEDLEAALGMSGSEAAASDPTRAELHERLARVYEKIGRRGEAAAEFETALALSPGRSDWRKELQRLSR